MQNKTSLCVDCPSFLTPPGYCEPVGSGVNQVLLVGSSPDRAAVQLGQAYSPYSEVGTILARACQLREMDLDQFTYTNLTWCPASPKREVLNYCAVKHLRPLIERLQPRMIVALGPDVIRELTGITGPKTDPRYTRGFVVDGINAAAGYPVKLTYDPLMVREGNMNLLGALAQDLDMARSQTKVSFKPQYKVGLEHCAEWFFDAKANSDLSIAYDIETAHSLKNDEDEVRGHSDAITQIQFSIRPNEALILPWSERAREFTKIVMALPNTKLGWNNLLFDDPHLKAEGVDIQGPVVDEMWCWHFLEPGLPYNLSHCTGTFVGNELPPWKHTMSADLHRYGGSDVDSLVRIYPRLVEALHAEGMWDAYQTFIVRFWKVLKDMSDRGFPFNLEKAAELREWVEGEKARIFADIQDQIPNTLKNVHPKEGYKKKPSPNSPGFKEEEGVMWGWDKDQNCWTKLETRTFGEEERWVRVKPFLVTSSDQIKRYATSKGQQLYKVKDGHKYKESTGKKELMKMVQKYGDPFYKTVIEYRELDKLAGTYLTWPVDSNGRVHAEFNFGPESGQIDTRSPNVNNVPKGTPLAKKIRACVAAAPGHTLVEIDVKGFHAKTLGYCARDAGYMRLAAFDIHSFLAAHILKLDFADRLMEMEDAELGERLEWVKANHGWVRNKKAKPCCIAEGQLVLTDKGLVPIERVTLEHKLWDGIEWVTHEGVIYQGEREVITYDGITATPDHKVYTEDGRKISLWQASQEMVRIERTGVGRQAIRTSHSRFAEDYSGERLQKTDSPMRDVSGSQDHRHGQLVGGTDTRLPGVFPNNFTCVRHLGKSLRRRCQTLLQAGRSGLQELWSARNRASFRVAEALYRVGRGEPTTPNLRGGSHRQDRQQWTLRARELETVHAARERSQSSQYGKSLMARGVDTSQDVARESIRIHVGPEADKGGLNRRTDIGKIRVYDIWNAGPRHRFTVGDRLLANCHGIGFGMGVGKLYTMNEESFESRAEAQAIHDLMKALFPKVFAWQTEIRNLAHAQKYLKTEFGCIRRFYDVFRWDYVRGVWRPGDQAEECIAFPPSNLAHCHIKLAMMRLNDRGLLDKYKLVNFIKDSLVFECPATLIDECVHEVRRELEAPSTVLIDSEVAPTGFWVGTDVEVGSDWASMKGYTG